LILQVTYVPTVGLAQASAIYGIVEAEGTLATSQLILLLKYLYLASFFAAFCTIFAKLSVAALILRIMISTTNKLRILLYVMMGSYIAMTIGLMVTVMWISCVYQAAWNPLPDAQCIDPRFQANVVMAWSAYGAFVDFALATLPISILWPLQMDRRRKIGVAVLLGMGWIAGIFSVLKAVQYERVATRPDPSSALYLFFIWTGWEIPLIIICGTIPTLRPLFEFFMRGVPLTPCGLPQVGASNRHATRRNYYEMNGSDVNLERMSSTSELVRVPTKVRYTARSGVSPISDQSESPVSLELKRGAEMNIDVFHVNEFKVSEAGA